MRLSALAAWALVAGGGCSLVASAAEPVVAGPDIDATSQSNQRPLWELGVAGLGRI